MTKQELRNEAKRLEKEAMKCWKIGTSNRKVLRRLEHVQKHIRAVEKSEELQEQPQSLENYKEKQIMPFGIYYKGITPTHPKKNLKEKEP